MVHPWDIRLAGAADLLHLAAIELAADELFPEDRIPESDDTLALALLEESCEAGFLWVAEQDQRLVGCVVGCQRVGRIHVYLLAVLPDFGRRGIGRQLMQVLLHEARHRGYLGVSLTTFGDLPWNGPFYRSLGFHIMEESALHDFYRDILHIEEALGMTQRVAMLVDFDQAVSEH